MAHEGDLFAALEREPGHPLNDVAVHVMELRERHEQRVLRIKEIERLIEGNRRDSD